MHLLFPVFSQVAYPDRAPPSSDKDEDAWLNLMMDTLGLTGLTRRCGGLRTDPNWDWQGKIILSF